MVAEAEEHAEADKQAKARVEAKNQLEAYLYSVRASASDEKLADKLSDEDKQVLTNTAKDGLAWLDEHQQEDKDAYEEKRKEVEAVANPILTKAYSSAGAGSSSGASGPSSPDDEGGSPGGDGPTVEEV